jgi:DNA-binding NarL/FixJ family response regulator
VHCQPVVGRKFCLRRRNGESRALAQAEFDFKSQEGATVIDLEQVKVTPRDQQVLNLLVQGCSNKEIAGQLNISPRTVKQHLRTLFLRAGIREGRKRVKLAIAMFSKEGEQS